MAKIDLSNKGEFKKFTRASFDRTDLRYGTSGDFHWQFAERLLSHTPIQTGEQIVDVATGTAPAAIMSAQLVGPYGEVFGIDLSPGILSIARRNYLAMNHTNVSLLCGDAEALPMESSCADGVICSSAIVWFPDIASALHSWHRVLRHGGWLAFSCFGGLARETIISLLGKLLLSFGKTLPELNSRTNTVKKCEQLLRHSQFRDITIAEGQNGQLPTDPERSFEWAWASCRRFGIDLPPNQLRELKERYQVSFSDLLSTQHMWNHDCELYVVAFKSGPHHD